MSVYSIWILTAFFAWSTAQSSIFTINTIPSGSFVYTYFLYEWDLSSGVLRLQHNYTLNQLCPNWNYTQIYVPFTAIYDRSNHLIPLFGDSGISYIIYLPDISCFEWTPPVPHWGEDLYRVWYYDVNSALQWTCVELISEQQLLCTSISANTGGIESFTLDVPSDISFPYYLTLSSWIDTVLVGFYGPIYPKDTFDTHLAFFQLEPSPPRVEDIGPVNYNVPSTNGPGLLTANFSMLVLGGPCTNGYILTVFDFVNLTNYYWDTEGKPSDGNHVCVGHDGGPHVRNIFWIGPDQFLSLCSSVTPLVKFSLDPPGFEVIPIPTSVSDLWIYAFN